MRGKQEQDGLSELAEELKRRAESARALLEKALNQPAEHARIQSKASAYEHAAELVLDYAERLSTAPAGSYVASRASVPARGEMWRAIRAKGGAITSTWIDEDGPGQTPSMADLWDRISGEVCSSTHLVLYVEKDDLPLKGALVEVGMALAARLEVRVVVRGFDSMDDVRRLLGSWVSHPMVSFWESPEVAVRIPPNGR